MKNGNFKKTILVFGAFIVGPIELVVRELYRFVARSIVFRKYIKGDNNPKFKKFNMEFKERRIIPVEQIERLMATDLHVDRIKRKEITVTTKVVISETVYEIRVPTREVVKKSKYPQISVVGIMRKRKLEDNSRAMAILVIILLLAALLSIFKVIEWGVFQIVLFIPIFLLYIRQFILDYRILKGFYGNNEQEAREIIEFIVKESSNIDFKDGGKPKKILSDEDLEEIKQAAFQPVPGFARYVGHNG